jgi:hypothetical protein
MSYVFVLLALALLMDFVPAIRQRSGKKMAVFLIVFLPALALAITEQMQIKVPSLMLVLGDLLKAIGLSY